ncbi:hypothetical protein ACFV0T_29420 [Streptomyces sp. NPDC059582]|uniref:hypothetical protein n=1 Tax=Streptomyces sp. NPDC059582 TaxID=3346875 RepID=UPI0036ABC62F
MSVTDLAHRGRDGEVAVRSDHLRFLRQPNRAWRRPALLVRAGPVMGLLFRPEIDHAGEALHNPRLQLRTVVRLL